MSHRELKIGFIGGGNMAQAMAGGLLRAGHAPAAIAIAEPDDTRRARWTALHPDIRRGANNPAVAASAEVLVLAVKPQVMPEVLAELAVAPRPAAQLVVSVAAGITLASIASGLKSAVPAVRVMPNQPALVGEGMSVMVAASGVTETQKAQALYLAQATGKALWIAEESLMDAVTAISGSGPAYFYLLIELMERSAVALGLPAEVARTLVRQTAVGAARSAIDPATDVAALRRSVTSPGGTTAAALAVLEQAGIDEILSRAITAARDRGAELGHGPR